MRTADYRTPLAIIGSRTEIGFLEGVTSSRSCSDAFRRAEVAHVLAELVHEVIEHHANTPHPALVFVHHHPGLERHLEARPAGIALLTAPLSTAMWFALIWVAHIGFDRAAGYGIKYSSSFFDTHLGRVGRGRAARG